MNIPDEVIEQAVAAHKAPRLHVNDTVHDRMIDMRAAASVVAEWARKVALLDAAAALPQLEGTQIIRQQSAAAWLRERALAEGDN